MPRCKNPNCRDKFKAKYFLQKHCMEKDECIRLEVEMKKETIWKEKRKEWKINTHAKENKKYLQDEINKLARMIDAKFGYGCIDMCQKPYGKQIDGAHYHSRGGNCSLRYNLHNIHSANSQCNCYSDKHKPGYFVGLEVRYGIDYANMVASDLPAKYPLIKLSNQEIHDKLTIVRKINREFGTYQFTNGKQARNLFNKIIGIYE